MGYDVVPIGSNVGCLQHVAIDGLAILIDQLDIFGQPIEGGPLGQVGP